MSSETPFYFAGPRHQLFGVFHEAAATSNGSAFVFCHPFGEEKLWAHRVYVSCARALAAAGHPVLRFDYMGNGDSGGTFAESTLESAQEDVLTAVQEIRRRTGRPEVSLLGLRLGGTVASLAAERLTNIDRLILWAPIVDGALYMQELLRINVSTQMTVYKEVRRDRDELVAALRSGATVNVDGYEMALPMFEQVAAVRLAAQPKKTQSPCLIVHINKLPGRPAPELEQLAGCYANARVVFAQEEPFWKEIQRFYDSAPALFQATRQWLDETPVPGVVAAS